MDYLTQYYKNRCNQLQEQISQINSKFRNISENYVPSNIGTAKTNMSTETAYGGGGVTDNIIAEFLSRWGQPGYDGAGLGRLLASMIPSGGNGVYTAAQRIMSANANPISASTGQGNAVDRFNDNNNTGNQQTIDQFLANWGQPGYDGAGLGQLLGNMLSSNNPSPNAYQLSAPQTINRNRRRRV